MPGSGIAARGREIGRGWGGKWGFIGVLGRKYFCWGCDWGGESRTVAAPFRLWSALGRSNRSFMFYSKKAILGLGAGSWSVETLNEVVDAELEDLPFEMLARFRHISLLIEEFGLERVREPHVKHIRGPLWEMRMTGRDGVSRALYVTAVGRRVVVVRVFIKKTQKTPEREIELALKRAEGIR